MTDVFRYLLFAFLVSLLMVEGLFIYATFRLHMVDELAVFILSFTFLYLSLQEFSFAWVTEEGAATRFWVYALTTPIWIPLIFIVFLAAEILPGRGGKFFRKIWERT